MSDNRPDIPDELRTPLQIVQRMDWLIFYAGKATRAIGHPEEGLKRKFLDAKDAYNKARLLHLDESAGSGTKGDREDKAQLDNWHLFQAMNEAELALQYARDKQADLERELSKLQTESKLVIKELEMAGRSS